MDQSVSSVHNCFTKSRKRSILNSSFSSNSFRTRQSWMGRNLPGRPGLGSTMSGMIMRGLAPLPLPAATKSVQRDTVPWVSSSATASRAHPAYSGLIEFPAQM